MMATRRVWSKEKATALRRRWSQRGAPGHVPVFGATLYRAPGMDDYGWR